jgi:uncharacterized membrane protein YkvI
LNKRTWTIAFAYVGVIVGAGLSSGQDLLQYFLSFGKIGLLAVVLLGVLNVVFGRIMVTLGSYYRSDNHEQVFDQLTHPIIVKILDWVLIIGDFVMGFVMIAGAGSNLQQATGLPAWAGALICALLIILVAFMDFEKITGVLGVFTPIMIVMILLITLWTFVGKSYDFNAIDAVAKTMPRAMDNVWLSVINYYALCAMTAVSMAFILGGSIIRIGIASKGGTLGGAMIAVIITAASFALYANIPAVKDADMPMLAIVSNISPILSWIYAFTIFALIFNTAFSLFYAIARRFSNGSEKRMRIVLIAIVVAGYIFSFGGFKNLIGWMYPLLGYMGILLLIVLAVGWAREKKNIKAEKFLRRKLIRISLKKHTAEDGITVREHHLFNFLTKISPADSRKLAKGVSTYAKKVADNVDDVKGFADENLSVDDQKLKESLEDRTGEMDLSALHHKQSV